MPNPLKGPPKIHFVLVKSHYLTILLTLPPATKISALKDEVLSAFGSEGYSIGLKEAEKEHEYEKELQEATTNLKAQETDKGKGKARDEDDEDDLMTGLHDDEDEETSLNPPKLPKPPTSRSSFNILKLVKGKSKSSVIDSLPPSEKEYQVLEDSKTIKDCGFAGWETVFIQFKDEKGNPKPLTVTLPPFDDEEPPLAEDSTLLSPSGANTESVARGKRKVREDDDDGQ